MALLILSGIVFLYIGWLVSNSSSTPKKGVDRIHSNTYSNAARKESLYDVQETDFSLLIKKAISMRSRLKIKYRDMDGVITIRTISPKVLFRTQYTNELALSTYCHLRGEDRTFMVDRIIEIEPV